MKSANNNNLDSSISLNLADSTSFQSFVIFLEELFKIAASNDKNEKKTDAKKAKIKDFINQWRKNAKTLASNNQNKQIDDSFLPCLKFLIPHEDRRLFNLKEARLAQVLIKSSDKSDKSAQGLLDYKKPENVQLEGDFASVACFALQDKCKEKNLSIGQIDKLLDKLSSKTEEKDLIPIFQHLITNVSGLQLKWLIRIILKDLKLGIKEQTILEAFHPDAIELFNSNSSIEKVCNLLQNQNNRLTNISISIMVPFKPCLGSTAKPSQIETLLKSKEFYIENKYDGERFQLHKQGDTFAYFSRNGHNFTETFGKSLTPFISDCFAKGVRNIILDGEICGYNTDLNLIVPKSENINMKSTNQKDNMQPCFCVFDILLFNDIVLTKLELKERIKYMERGVIEKEGRLLISKRKLAKTNQEVVNELNNAIDLREEGILVKDPSSIYRPNARDNCGWFKVKPDYMNGLNDDLDLIIVGGYYGIGKRSGLISQFLLAVALDEQTHAAKDEDELDLDETEKKISYPKTFLSFCRIGSGYSLKELKEFNQKISKKCKDFDKKNPPKHLQLTGDEKPDCWIEPKDSCIVQVKAVEICSSEKYKAGVSLRFPRLVSFRQDKEWHECMRLSELNELKEKNNGKLASGKHLILDDPNEDKENLVSFGQPAFKKRKSNESSSSSSSNVVHPRFAAIDTSGVKVSSGLFQNKEFYVVIDLYNEVYDRKAIETEIVKLGGRTTMSPNEGTIIVATQKLHRLNGYIKKDSNDIVKIEWLTKCIQDNTLYEYKRSDMIHSKKETLKRLNQLYDCFGDSYTQPATVDSLREVFQGMEKRSYNKEKIRISLASFENKSFPDDSFRFGLFRIVNAYVDVMCSSLELIGLKIRWLGGLCSDQINENTTHVIFDKKDVGRMNEFNELNRQRSKKFHVVSSEWVIDSIEAHKLLQESAYY